MVKGGSRSRFTENKTVHSQLTRNKDIMKIKVHGKLNINFAKSCFTATMEITIHEEKISHFTGKKRLITSHENTLYHPLPNVALKKVNKQRPLIIIIIIIIIIMIMTIIMLLNAFRSDLWLAVFELGNPDRRGGSRSSSIPGRRRGKKMCLASMMSVRVCFVE